MRFDKNTEAPILIVLGQSNAQGSTTRLSREMEINSPLKNVYGLSRDDNQAFGLKEVIWSGYTSYGMNLGQKEDHTYCLATEFARGWQERIDKGEKLPDLYIIHISIGGQGVNEHESLYEGKEMNMWYPEREKVMDVKDPAQPDISLYPFALEILKLSMDSIYKMGKTPVIIGLHWNQWEAEVDMGGTALENAYKTYTQMWDGFREALGMEYPLYLYKPLSELYNNPKGVEKITNVFERFVHERNCVKMLDVSKTSGWRSDTKDHGIFGEDYVHYLPWVHQWFAEKQFEEL